MIGSQNSTVNETVNNMLLSLYMFFAKVMHMTCIIGRCVVFTFGFLFLTVSIISISLLREEKQIISSPPRYFRWKTITRDYWGLNFLTAHIGEHFSRLLKSGLSWQDVLLNLLCSIVTDCWLSSIVLRSSITWIIIQFPLWFTLSPHDFVPQHRCEKVNISTSTTSRFCSS